MTVQTFLDLYRELKLRHYRTQDLNLFFMPTNLQPVFFPALTGRRTNRSSAISSERPASLANVASVVNSLPPPFYTRLIRWGRLAIEHAILPSGSDGSFRNALGLKPKRSSINTA